MASSTNVEQEIQVHSHCDDDHHHIMRMMMVLWWYYDDIIVMIVITIIIILWVLWWYDDDVRPPGCHQEVCGKWGRSSHQEDRSSRDQVFYHHKGKVQKRNKLTNVSFVFTHTYSLVKHVFLFLPYVTSCYYLKKENKKKTKISPFPAYTYVPKLIFVSFCCSWTFS